MEETLALPDGEPETAGDRVPMGDAEALDELTSVHVPLGETLEEALLDACALGLTWEVLLDEVRGERVVEGLPCSAVGVAKAEAESVGLGEREREGDAVALLPGVEVADAQGVPVVREEAEGELEVAGEGEVDGDVLGLVEGPGLAVEVEDKLALAVGERLPLSETVLLELALVLGERVGDSDTLGEALKDALWLLLPLEVPKGIVALPLIKEVGVLDSMPLAVPVSVGLEMVAPAVVEGDTEGEGESRALALALGERLGERLEEGECVADTDWLGDREEEGVWESRALLVELSEMVPACEAVALREGERDGLVDGVLVVDWLGERLCVPDTEGDALPTPESVPLLALGGLDCVALRLGVLLAEEHTLTVGELLLLALTDGECEELGEPEKAALTLEEEDGDLGAEFVPLGVGHAAAVAVVVERLEAEPACDGERDRLGEPLAEGLTVPDWLTLGVRDTLGEVLGEAVLLTEWLHPPVRVALEVRLGEKVPERVPEAHADCVLDWLALRVSKGLAELQTVEERVTLAVLLRVALPLALLLGHAVEERVTLAQPEALDCWLEEGGTLRVAVENTVAVPLGLRVVLPLVGRGEGVAVPTRVADAVTLKDKLPVGLTLGEGLWVAAGENDREPVEQRETVMVLLRELTPLVGSDVWDSVGAIEALFGALNDLLPVGLTEEVRLSDCRPDTVA